jgi:hypothetical protein
VQYLIGITVTGHNNRPDLGVALSKSGIKFVSPAELSDNQSLRHDYLFVGAGQK